MEIILFAVINSLYHFDRQQSTSGETLPLDNDNAPQELVRIETEDSIPFKDYHDYKKLRNLIIGFEFHEL
ncbi:MAG: hypothetical protein HUJ51_05180 [Eggerthellaceae bacterium]|nr:hypothetical protein [Eggerthellaceae bacterium]